MIGPHRLARTLFAATALATAAQAQFFTESFEGYSVGPLEGQGCWHPGSGGPPTAFAQVVSAPTFDGARAGTAVAGADTVHEFGRFTSGKWRFSVMTYVPSALNGKSFFFLFNDYVAGGPAQFSLSVGFNGITNLVECDCGATTPSSVPVVFDAWRQLSADIDLDADTCTVFYGATQLGTYAWSKGVYGLDNFPDRKIDALCLFPDPASNPNVSEVYYDALTVFPIGGGPGQPFCFGDGSGSPCPCGNEGCTGEGCRNSSGSGAELWGAGSASVATDDLTFRATDLLPGQPVLLFVGENATAGGDGFLFGDGLRCAGMNVLRLGTVTPNAAGEASWGPGLGALAGWSVSDLRFFQAWYRDPAGSPCGAGFNLANAYSVLFQP